MKDYHVHSGFLDHTKDDLDSIAETACQLGYQEIAFTEHLIWTAMVHPKREEETLFAEHSQIPRDGRKTTDLQTYRSEIERVSEDYHMRILSGLEVDYFPEYEAEIRDLLRRFRFQLVLGSCHYVRDGDLPEEDRYIHVGSGERMRAFMDKHGEERAYEDYFRNVERAVRSGLFDVMAHLDFLKKAMPDYSHEKALRYIIPILRLMIERDVGLEINVKGLKNFGEPFPSYDVIDAYRNMGGRKISVGSDAHGVRQLIEASPSVERHERRYCS
jgi:histidinol-phosphatase (PHP family)